MKLTKTYPVILKKEVLYFYSLEADLSEIPGDVHRRLPDGTLELIISLGDPIYNITENGEAARRPDIMITGLFRQGVIFQYTGKIHVVGAIFQPGYASAFVNDNLDHFSECIYSADLIYKNEINSLPEMLFNFPSEKQKHHFLETFLSQRLKKRNNDHHITSISHAVQLIHQSKGDIDMPFLSQHVFMSERNFRRRFSELVGMNPKLYAGIIRVKSIVKSHDAGASFSGLLYSHGYTDHSHFIKDFKRIAGVAPSAFFCEINPIDELYIKSAKS